jgi:hypothetical protein
MYAHPFQDQEFRWGNRIETHLQGSRISFDLFLTMDKDAGKHHLRLYMKEHDLLEYLHFSYSTDSRSAVLEDHFMKFSQSRLQSIIPDIMQRYRQTECEYFFPALCLWAMPARTT